MIGFWTLIVIGVIAVLAICGFWSYHAYKENNLPHKVLSVFTGITLILALIIVPQWWLNNTASGIRMQISWQSEINLGLERTATVYSATGELVYEFSGRFDVTHDGSRILFDVVHDDGSVTRHIIYSPTGTVVIVEH